MSENNNIYKKRPIGISPQGKAFSAIIVEDSAASRLILKQMLLSVQFNVIAEFINGEQAVQKITNGDFCPDYLFVDYEMPLLNGLDVIRQVKPLLPNCKIYMITSHSQKEQVEEIMKLGIAGYIKKPYDRDLLIARLSGD
jgi:DNA-binding NarL/FixJ family response regulator